MIWYTQGHPQKAMLGRALLTVCVCRYICVLGVDFMSENVRAILDEAGFTDVPVYRMSPAAIGCSLAEAAESAQYMHYLDEASHTPNSMHVVYINTSLYTKVWLVCMRKPLLHFWGSYAHWCCGCPADLV